MKLSIISRIADVLLLCGIAFCARWLILCLCISCRNFFASILILTGDWLNTYLPVSQSEMTFTIFFTSVYGTPVNQICPVTGSIIYPRCLKMMGSMSLFVAGPDICMATITSGYLEACIIRWACLCPFGQGLVLWWKTWFASYHLSATEFWNFHCPAEIFCNDLPTMFCHCSSSQFRHHSFPLSRGAPEFVRLPAFSKC